MDRRQLPLIPLLLLLALAAGNSVAGVYSWKDADGRTHFSDRAPGDNNTGNNAGGNRSAATAAGDRLQLTITEHGTIASPTLRDDADAGLRRVYRLYKDIFRLDVRARAVVDVHLFADQAALVDWVEQQTGERRPRIKGVYLVKSRLVGVAAGEGDADALRTILHEGNHVLLAQLAPNVPLWLHEGLSQYVEGIGVDDNDTLVVAPHPENAAVIAAWVKRDQLIPIRDYLAIPPARWQALVHDEGHPVPYVVAWSFTSFLMAKPVRRQFLREIMHDIEKSRAVPELDTFARRYPGGFTVMEYDWYRYAQQAPAEHRLE